MSNLIPSYVPDNIKKTTRNEQFADIRIPNYISTHPNTIYNNNMKMDDATRKAIHQKAIVNRNTELARLENAMKNGRISSLTYKICQYIFNNVVNDYHDTSMVDNGYFLNMTEMVNFALSSGEKKVQHILYRYLFLTDVMVMDSFSRNMVGLRDSNKEMLAGTINDIFSYPYEVDLKKPKLLITMYERNANTPSSKGSSSDEDTFLLTRRLHEFRESPQGRDAQLSHFLLEDFITKYRAQIDDDLADTKISLAQFTFNSSPTYRTR